MHKYSSPNTFRTRIKPTLAWAVAIIISLIVTTGLMAFALFKISGLKATTAPAAAPPQSPLDAIFNITQLNDIGWFISNSLGLSIALVAGCATILLAVQSWILAQNQIRLTAQEFLSKDLEAYRDTAVISKDLMFGFAQASLKYANANMAFFRLSTGNDPYYDYPDDYEQPLHQQRYLISDKELTQIREVAKHEVISAAIQIARSDESNLEQAMDEADAIINAALDRVFFQYRPENQEQWLDELTRSVYREELAKWKSQRDTDRVRKEAEKLGEIRQQWLESLHKIVQHISNPHADPISKAVWRYNLHSEKAKPIINQLNEIMARNAGYKDYEQLRSENDFYEWESEKYEGKPARRSKPEMALFAEIEASLHGHAIINVDAALAEGSMGIPSFPPLAFHTVTSKIAGLLPRPGFLYTPSDSSPFIRMARISDNVLLYTDKESEFVIKSDGTLGDPEELSEEFKKKHSAHPFLTAMRESGAISFDDARNLPEPERLKDLRRGSGEDHFGAIFKLFSITLAQGTSAKGIRSYLEGSVDAKLIDDIILANARYIPEDSFDLFDEPVETKKETKAAKKA